MSDIQEFGKLIKDDVLTIVAGAYIGRGMSRYVYEYVPNERYRVVKVEGGNTYQNITEFNLWKAFRDSKFARWFAPVELLSGMGRVLVMHRTEPVALTDLNKELRKVPAIFTDFKVGNWGRLLDGKHKGEIVCHDYGTARLGRDITKMRVPKWWREEDR